MDKEHYICIDIGGTAIKYGLADENGNFIEKNSMPTEAKMYGGPGIVEKVKNIIRKYIKAENIGGVGISTSGIVDAKSGLVVYVMPEAIPDYSNTPLKTIVENEFNIKCSVENDVNCAALGEMWLGAGKGKSSLFCMTIGTSIGGCAVYGGRVIHGASNSAGEIAYMKIPGGTMHELVSTTRLVKDVAKAKSMNEMDLNGEKIFAWAKAGDEVSQKAIEDLMNHLADGIVNIAAVLNPQMVILGGGIMAQGEYLRPIINEALKMRLAKNVYESTQIEFAKLKNDAGMTGALYNLLLQIK